MGRASNKKWMQRAWRYAYSVWDAKKKGKQIPLKPYEHRKFWRAFVNIMFQ